MKREPIIKLFRPRLTLGRGDQREREKRLWLGVGGELPAIGQLTSALENNEASRVVERTVTSNLAPTYNCHVHRARVCVCECVCVCVWMARVCSRFVALIEEDSSRK